MATRFQFRSLLQVGILSIAAALVSACGGGYDDDDSIHVSGTVHSVVTDAVQASRDYIVLDADNIAADPVASGKSDSNGSYEFNLKGILRIVIVFPPVSTPTSDPRSSGLLSLTEGYTTKPLNDVTDLACQAGVTAITQGAVESEDMDAVRIANLELAAAQVISEDDPDFTNTDEMSAAVQRVRDLTDDGDHPPA